MRLKSLIAAVALGVGLAGTGLAAAEATTAPPKPGPTAPPKPTTSPGRPTPSHPGVTPKPSKPPIAKPPGTAIPKAPNYTG